MCVILFVIQATTSIAIDFIFNNIKIRSLHTNIN